MRCPRRPRAILGVGAALAVIAALLLGGCGRRGAPVPPRLPGPEAVSSFSAEATARSVLVTWARPTRDTDGRTLRDLQEFRLFRATGADPAFAQIAAVRAEHPSNAAVRDSRYAFQDDGDGTGLDPALRYTYRVVAVNARGVLSPPSADVAVEFLLPPPVPTGLTAIAGEGAVDLAWEAPPSGGERTVAVRGYNVYRGEASGAYGSSPINARPLAETRFRDAGIRTDTPYVYVVRSVGTERPPWRESVDSAEASVRLEDRTPPAPPRGLVAIAGPSAVALSWRPNAEPDLLGYLVYRRETVEVTAVRLTPDPILPTTFSDRTARPGAAYVYSVTAVDRSPHKNESAPSGEAEAAMDR